MWRNDDALGELGGSKMAGEDRRSFGAEEGEVPKSSGREQVLEVALRTWPFSHCRVSSRRTDFTPFENEKDPSGCCVKDRLPHSPKKK